METFWKILDIIKALAGFFLIFGITFEISPTKINPLQWIGKRLNKTTNDRIDKIQKQVDDIQYNEDMKDLRTIKSRVHSYGMLIRKGETLPEEVLKSAIDDLDMYDYYKEKYQYMYINGCKVKINGEMKADRTLVEDQLYIVKKENI